MTEHPSSPRRVTGFPDGSEAFVCHLSVAGTDKWHTNRYRRTARWGSNVLRR